MSINKRKYIETLDKYADYVIAQPDSAAYLKNNNPIWFYVTSEKPINKDYFKKYNNKLIRICHIPSNSKIKLSHIIIPVLKKLEDERNDVEIII